VCKVGIKNTLEFDKIASVACELLIGYHMQMPEILNDLSDVQLANKANEDNLTSFWLNYGRTPGCEAHQDARLTRFAIGIPLDILNGVVGAKLPAGEVESTITAMLDYFRPRRVPIRWWVGPETQPADLGRYLEAAGFVHAGDTPGMAVELRELPESMPTPTGFTISVVEDEPALRQWIDVLNSSYHIPVELHQPTIDLELRRAVGLPTSPRRYLGLCNGDPVAISALHLDAGVAGVHVVGTIPEGRGKGFGAAITLRPLLDARTMGYRVGTLQSSKMGFQVYQRLGFKTFCQFGVYIWSGARR
jgi:hypothetical protein